jgi:N6-adenosine-specific RNA methylase IME4
MIAIASDPRIVSHAIHLPPAWETLYALTRLSAERFQELFQSGVINPGMMRKDIKAAEKAEKVEQRNIREEKLAAEMPAGQFGVILADPEWRFEPWSRETGMDRAADQHYSTSPTEIIASRDVASIAADDCVLFMWATVPMLPQAIEVGRAWGFEYRSHCIWAKDKEGTGYWFRNTHELLLVFTRGNIPAPAPGQQWGSLIEAPVGEHSQKPSIFYEMIEQLYPNLPKIELNARGPAREGWSVWGYEAGVYGAEIDGTFAAHA